MTREEFLQRLSETPRTWWVGVDGELRCDHRQIWCCPITALAPKPRGAGFYRITADQIGIPFNFVRTIIAAADNRSPTTRKTKDLRADLLRACGLA